MQVYHILNGDALREKFVNAGIDGEVIVCRECFIDGPCHGSIADDFWARREKFICETYDSNDTGYRGVKSEFQKIGKISEKDEVNIWFENDLFCQANYWFTLKLFSGYQLNVRLFRVFPHKQRPEEKWTTFGGATKDDIRSSLQNRKVISQSDLELGAKLWDAYAGYALAELVTLSSMGNEGFEGLNEVVLAHLDRFPLDRKEGRPQLRLLEIVKEGKVGFTDAFKEFTKREPIYGFGDRQVEAMWRKFVKREL